MENEKWISIKEAAKRASLTCSYFYTNKSLGRLTLPVTKIGRSIRIKESDFNKWMAGEFDSSCEN